MTARRPLVAGIAIAVGLTVAACGSSSNSSVAAVGTSPATTGGAAGTTTPGIAPNRQAIQQCLAQKGFSLPQGGFRGGGGGPPPSGSVPAGTAPASGANQVQPPTSRPPLDPQLQQALRDCGAGTGFGRGGDGGGAGFNDPALRQCLADHGVTLPQPGAGSAPSAPPSSASANLRQAMQACRVQLAPTTTSPPATG
jgi:hypothetical protein